MNQVTLIGRLGSDAQLRNSQNNMAIANFSVATSEKMKGDTGEYKTTWHRVILFGKYAESIGHLLTKGSEVLVMGKINYNEWTDKSGNKQKSTDIIAYTVKVIQNAKKQQGDFGGDRYEESQSPLMQGGLSESDIPF